MNRVALLLMPVTLLAAGCATGPQTGGLGGGDYARSQARSAQHVEIGFVEAVRAVRLDASSPGFQNSVAPMVGAVAGGALGSTIGKGNGKKAAIVLGALAGAGAGAAVRDAGNTIKGLEITVRLPRGLLAITQADEGIEFRPGDQVSVLQDGQTWRVAKN